MALWNKLAARPAMVVGGLLCLAVPATAQTAAAPQAATGAGAGAGADQVAQGKYLTDLADCAACHTRDGGPAYAGGRYIPTPFGPISSPNITPDQQTGIGKYTDDQFYRVLHNGISPHGEYIYPAMPFPWYTIVTRDDALAIKAYLFSLAPVHAPRPPSHMAFPFNVRSGLGVWDAMFFSAHSFKPDPTKSAAANRGAYLVEGLGHCGACHNGRNLLGNTAAAENLQGGPIQQWYAPNITSDVRTGIGKYSDAQLVSYLKTGTAPGMGVVAGPMSETVHESLRHLTDADLQAIVAYLRSTPARPSYAPVHAAEFAQGNSAGAQVYLSNCASCHQVDGRGVAGAVPTLVGNGAVTAAGSQDVIRVILGGLEAQGTYAPMPGVGAAMTDQEIAQVVNYVRQSWGNAAPPNAGGGEVAALRRDTHTLLNATTASGCPTLAQPDLARAVADPSTGIGDLLHGITLVNLLPSVDKIIDKAKAAAPNLSQADLVNGLTVAYCPVVAADPKIPLQQKAAQLGQFGERVYTQLADRGKG